MDRIHSSSPSLHPTPSDSTGALQPNQTTGAPTARRAGGELSGLAKRTSLIGMPREIKSLIADNLSNKEVLRLGKTAGEMYTAVSPHLNRARLTSLARNATTLQALGSLLKPDTPDEAPTPLHPEGRPNTIKKLLKDLQDEPHAAAALRLQALSMYMHNADPNVRIQVFGYVWTLIQALPLEHREPALVGFAPMVSRLPHPYGTQAFVEMLDEILKQPPPQQIAALQGLAGALTSFQPVQARLAGFTRLLDKTAAHGPDNLITLLRALFPVIPHLPPAHRSAACDAVLRTMASLPAETETQKWDLKDMHDRLVNPIANSVPLGQRRALWIHVTQQVPRLTESHQQNVFSTIMRCAQQLPVADRDDVVTAVNQLR